MQHFPHKDKATLVAVKNLADEADVAKLYDGVGGLWASIHIAGGFAPGTVAETDKAALMGRSTSNLVSCFLCCRAAIRAMSKRRPHRQCRGTSGAGMAFRRRNVGLYRKQSGRRGADSRAGRRSRQRRHSGECGRSLDHGHAGQPQGDAESGFRQMAESRGGRGDDRVSRLDRTTASRAAASCRCTANPDQCDGTSSSAGRTSFCTAGDATTVLPSA